MVLILLLCLSQNNKAVCVLIHDASEQTIWTMVPTMLYIPL